MRPAHAQLRLVGAIEFALSKTEMNPPYETVYGVQLFDDLHNYLPDLLYNHGRFQNMTQVFHYIRTQMSSRFNLYARGAMLYNEANTPFTFTTTFATPTPTPPPIPRTPVTPMPAATTTAAMPMTTIPTTTATTNFLLNLLGLGLGNDLFQMPMPGPVIVRPSTDVLQNNTELLDGNALTETTTCAVCQEPIGPNDRCRRLRPCQHVYHRACIDVWFERSVFCPTCRHDIREQN